MSIENKSILNYLLEIMTLETIRVVHSYSRDQINNRGFESVFEDSEFATLYFILYIIAFIIYNRYYILTILFSIKIILYVQNEKLQLHLDKLDAEEIIYIYFNIQYLLQLYK